VPLKRLTFKQLGLLVGTLAVAYSILAFCASLYARRQATVARDLLIELRRLDVGTTQFQEVLQIRRDFERVSRSTPSCSAQSCRIEFRFTNRAQYWLGLSPLTVFGVGLTINGNRLREMDMTLAAAPHAPPAYTVSANSRVRDSLRPEEDAFEVIFHETRDHPGEAFMKVRPGATSQQRELAFAFNLSCLYQLGGCKSSPEIVPGWWEIERQKPPRVPPPE
jgi:hypothetical protein